MSCAVLRAVLAAALLGSSLATVPAASGAEASVDLTPASKSIFEGESITMVARFSPTGSEVPRQFRFEWGDGTVTNRLPPAVPPYTVRPDHAYADEGIYLVRVQVTGTGMEPVNDLATLTVVNTAPVLAAIPDTTAPLGGRFRLQVAFRDPGSADTHRVSVDWGDGVFREQERVTGGRAVLTHVYHSAGARSVLVRVDDGDGGTDEQHLIVTVAPFCGGKPVTIDLGSLPPGPVVGTPGPDVILGSSGPDVISGGGGADVICGRGGADILNGGPGDDVLLGGAGADRIIGGPGSDVLAGGLGRDSLLGGPGSDVLHGGGGVDELLGQEDGDFLFRSEYPNLDRMGGGPGENVVDTGKRGSESTGIRRHLTQAEALAFQGAYLLGEFATYHDCCQNRVVNIHLMADTVNGHVVMPGETFSVNATVGQRTTAKGYLPAGAIIGGYVQCCGYADNIGGGTSQFGTTIYNAAFFAGLEDVEHQPHSLDFARYPDGREATMGWPRPDVAFRNDTAHPVLVTTHHSGFRGTSITVKIWGDNGGRQVTAGASPRRNVHYTSRVVEEIDWSLGCGQSCVTSSSSPGYTIDVFRYITYPGGRRTSEKWTWTYSAGPEVRRVGVCSPPADGGGDGGSDGGVYVPE